VRARGRLDDWIRIARSQHRRGDHVLESAVAWLGKHESEVAIADGLEALMYDPKRCRRPSTKPVCARDARLRRENSFGPASRPSVVVLEEFLCAPAAFAEVMPDAVVRAGSRCSWRDLNLTNSLNERHWGER